MCDRPFQRLPGLAEKCAGELKTHFGGGGDKNIDLWLNNLRPLKKEEKDQVGIKSRKKKKDGKNRRRKRQRRIFGKSLSLLCSCPWSHSPSTSLPIKVLIKTDKVSPNEERAVGGLNCWSLSITLPEESGEGRARGYSNDTQSRGRRLI